MDVTSQINAYIDSLAQGKRADMLALHNNFQKWLPGARLWFLDGKNQDGKTVSNPNIGYGNGMMKYADGKTREFYQVGLSANTGGISVYFMGLPDKTFLSNQYAKDIGKATITGYCIRFKKLADIDLMVLENAVRKATL